MIRLVIGFIGIAISECIFVILFKYKKKSFCKAEYLIGLLVRMVSLLFVVLYELSESTSQHDMLLLINNSILQMVFQTYIPKIKKHSGENMISIADVKQGNDEILSLRSQTVEMEEKIKELESRKRTIFGRK